MSLVSRAKHLYRRVLHRGRTEAELDEEVQAYFETQIERHLSRGLSQDEARRAARISYGGPEQVKEKVRDARAGKPSTPRYGTYGTRAGSWRWPIRRDCFSSTIQAASPAAATLHHIPATRSSATTITTSRQSRHSRASVSK